MRHHNKLGSIPSDGFLIQQYLFLGHRVYVDKIGRQVVLS